MYVDQIKKMMTSKILSNLLVSETFIARGLKVNLINEDRGIIAQGIPEKEENEKTNQRIASL